MLERGDTNAIVVFGGDDGRAEKYDWTTLTIPKGQTDKQFAQAVTSAFNKLAASNRGNRYSPHGLLNSNQFVHQVVRSAGGVIPRAVLRFGVTPGICGGTYGMSGFVLAGPNCSR